MKPVMWLRFTLSMPGVASWNGKWGGEGRPHVVVRKSSKDLSGYYTYDFGDGWCAGISVDRIDVNEARRLKRKGSDFYGYDWMVDSILDFGKILNQKQRQEMAGRS